MKKDIEYRVIFEFIQVLEGLEKFLSPPLGLNKDLLAFVRKLRDALAANENISSSILLNHIEKLSGPKKKSKKPYDKEIDKENFNDMSIAEIEALLANESLSKNNLLSIAEVRFGAPSGTLKRFNIPTLREKLRGMINNEKSHQSIAKIASSIPGDVTKDYSRKSQSDEIKGEED